MKKIYFVICLLMLAVFHAQIVNIPDANFKARLLLANTSNSIALNSSNQGIIIDTNGDNEIQVSEALNVYKLNISGSPGSVINDVTGINQFGNITSLIAASNNLTNVQISGLPNIEAIHFGNNNLTTLSLSNLSNLQTLSINNNQLTTFSLNNIPNLKILNCNSNQLVTLDISIFPNLVNLECKNNLLTTLTLNNNNHLLTVIAENNQLVSCAFEEAPILSSLYVKNNLFTTIDAGQLGQLSYFDFSNNPNLINFNIKNGKNNYAQYAVPMFSNTPNLKHICVDDFELAMISGLTNYYNQPNVVLNSYCSFTPGGTFYTVQGNTKLDSNNNGCDSSDPAKTFQKFSITNSFNSGNMIANSSGNYSIPVQAGNHTIVPILENPTYFNISPTSLIANFPAQTSPLSQNFCISANGIHNDLEVVIIPITAAAPGFNAKYKIIYKNNGTAVQGGTVVFNFNDNLMNFVSSTISPNSQSTGILTWNFTNLLPFETREITATFTLNTPMQTPPLNGGQVLNYTAQINGLNDETPLDNTFTLNQTVVNSFDPNDKTCLEGATITQAKVGDYVHYLIRFENTGTANAQNIVVKDMIDTTKFDLATLVPLHASHSFITRITNPNTVEFIFENIQLPFADATNDGYVSFKIKTKSTLTLGQSFNNTANIYFDYNFPIVTNTYTTTVQNVLATSEVNNDDQVSFTIYPNPVNNILSVKTDTMIIKAEIYDATGRIVNSTGVKNNSIDVSNLPKGNYIIKFYTDDKAVTQKFIKN